MIIVIILFLLFALLAGLVYLTLFILTNLSLRLTNKLPLTIDNKRKFKKALLISSLVISSVAACLFLFTTPSTNYKTAFIEREKDHFALTVKGKRSLMAHDPVSLFLRKTYEDSRKYIIPRNQGIIKGEELPTEPGYYKSVGTITIQNNQAEINLSYDNYDDKKIEADGWNGKYKLVWRDK